MNAPATTSFLTGVTSGFTACFLKEQTQQHRIARNTDLQK